jgi:hypothetical protein
MFGFDFRQGQGLVYFTSRFSLLLPGYSGILPALSQVIAIRLAWSWEDSAA